MKIVQGTWQKFVLWAIILSAILGAIRDKAISFSLAGLFGCILSGLFIGSIIYGIWYGIIGRKKMSQDSSKIPQSKWDIVKGNLKILGFILLVLFVIGILISIIVPLLVRNR